MSVLEQHEHWMRRALVLADRAENEGEVPIGAIVVKDEQLIGEGWNSVISDNDPSAHAEVMALRDAAANVGNYRLPGCTLYVTLEPCSMCAGALVHARVACVVFAASEPKAGVIHSNCAALESSWYNHRVAWVGDVLADESAHRLRSFFASRR